MALVVSGCGGGSSSGGGGDSHGTSFADQSGDDIARAAAADLQGVTSMRMKGDLHVAGAHEALALMVDTSGDCRGTVRADAAAAQIIAVAGKVWIKPNTAFFERNAPGHGAELSRLVGDHWIVGNAALAQVCDLDNFLDSFRHVAGSATPQATKLGPATVDGRPAVRIQGHADDGGNVVAWIATTGKHYLLELRMTGGSSPAALTFSDFNRAVGAHPPSPSDVVDLSGAQQG